MKVVCQAVVLDVADIFRLVLGNNCIKGMKLVAQKVRSLGTCVCNERLFYTQFKPQFGSKKCGQLVLDSFGFLARTSKAENIPVGGGAYQPLL